jgi:hypothetical protein
VRATRSRLGLPRWAVPRPVQRRGLVGAPAAPVASQSRSPWPPVALLLYGSPGHARDAADGQGTVVGIAMTSWPLCSDSSSLVSSPALAGTFGKAATSCEDHWQPRSDRSSYETAGTCCPVVLPLRTLVQRPVVDPGSHDVVSRPKQVPTSNGTRLVVPACRLGRGAGARMPSQVFAWRARRWARGG